MVSQDAIWFSPSAFQPCWPKEEGEAGKLEGQPGAREQILGNRLEGLTTGMVVQAVLGEGVVRGGVLEGREQASRRRGEKKAVATGNHLLPLLESSGISLGWVLWPLPDS